MIKYFYELDVWKKGRILTKAIYACTKLFPKDETFGLSSQMRRSSTSVIANIAEGFGRQSLKEKINFYNQAHGSLTELQSHIFVCSDMEYINQKQSKELYTFTLDVQLLLRSLIKSTKRRLAS